MGGKDKQRTKGNLKPSSSGRAAELMTKGGAVGFVGFGQLGSPGGASLGYVPMATNAGDDVDNTVDGEFRMTMRKLMKRDGVTKLKAVQEFTVLCKNLPTEAVESALPFWPRLYNKLAVDNDHRVREATQQAMEQMVIRVRRNLAPHLRVVMGSWLCCQFDTYAPVASTAQRAFNAAFSDEKQAEAIIFCKKELVELFQDNILNQTPTSLSDPKFVPQEERETKYSRVVSSSIMALGHVIYVASDEVNAEMEKDYAILFKQNKFWKFARHKSPNIRGAVFSLVATCCQRLPVLMGSFASQVCPTVLSALDESDPAVCQHLWTAVLSVLQYIQDSWLHVNVRKAVLPKLWSLLRSGANGCASVIFPNLLPFLSKIPSEAIGSGPGFYKEFFSNFQEGLKKEKVLNISSECSAVVTAFMECLRFSLLHSSRCSSQESENEVQEYLVKEQLLPLVKMSLERKSKLSSSTLYQHLGNLLSFLSGGSTEPLMDHQPQGAAGNATNGDEEKSPGLHVKIRDWFWEGFGVLCQGCLQEDQTLKVDAACLDSLSHCLVCLKSPSKRKKKPRVAFLETSFDSSSCDERIVAQQTDAFELSTQTPISEGIDVEKLYNGRLIELICSICRLCLVEIRTRGRMEHARLLACIVPAFVCTRLLNALMIEHCEFSYSCDVPTLCSYDDLCCYCIFSIVLPCMSCPQQELAQDKIWNQESVEFVVDIVCGVVRTLPDERQAAVISKMFEDYKGVHLLRNMFNKGQQFGLNGLTRWLQSSAASATIVSLAQSLAVVLPHETSDGLHKTERVLSQGERRAIWQVIQFWLTTDAPGFSLNTESVDIIFKYFLEILNEAERQLYTEELPQLLGILHSYFKQCDEGICETVTSLEDILLAIYKLQLSGRASCLKGSVTNSLKELWRSGLDLFSHSPPPLSDCETLLIKATALIRENVNQSETVERLETLAGESLKLIEEADHLTVNSESEASFTTRHICPSLVPGEKEFVLLRAGSSEIPWLAIPLLNGTLPAVSTPPTDYSQSDIVSPDKNLTEHQKITMFCAQLLKALVSNSDDRVELIQRDSFIPLWLELAWIHKLYISTGLAHNPTKDLWFGKLSEVIADLLAHIRANEWHDALFVESFARAKSEGFLWALVLGTVLEHLQELEILTDVHVLLADVQSAAGEKETYCQTLTTLIPHLNSIYDVKVMTEHYSKLLSEENSESAFAFILASLSSCLAQWGDITAGREEAVLEFQLTLTEVLHQLFEWKQKNDVMMLSNSTTQDASISVVSMNVAIVNIFKLAILRAPENIKAAHWDFILCSLIGWLQTCDESRSSLSSSLKCLVLCYHVCTLHATVAQFFEQNTSKLQEASKTAHVSQDPDVMAPPVHDGVGFPPNLLNEWEEFFSTTVYGTLLSVFLNCAGKISKSPFVPSLSRLSEAIGTAVTFTPLALLKVHKCEGTPLARAGDSTVPLWAQDLLTVCVPLLTCHVHSLQFAAYHLLLRVMPELVACEVQRVDSDERNEASRSPPGLLMGILEISSLRMTEILSDASVSFGEHLSMSDDFEAQNTSLSLVLAFKLLVRFFRCTSQEMRPEYATFLRRNKHVTDFLGILFGIIPIRMTGVTVKDAYEPAVVDRVTERLVQELACGVFYSLLQCMPAIVRQWWNGLEKRQSAIVDKFVTSHISPLLCQREIQVVQNSSVTFENMQVRTRPSAREVAAIYTMEEISMEMLVKLAPNHPLGTVAVESGKRVGVNTAQWRSWMLQLTTFLMHQNGSIMDGLIMWKRNVDKRFEGVDDCMICFSVIHGSNYSLPKLTCKTCKKKFHSICLYKWFSKSNNSTCPMCRNLF